MVWKIFVKQLEDLDTKEKDKYIYAKLEMSIILFLITMFAIF